MSRSGKTVAASQLAAARSRVVVWDLQQDWLKYDFAKAESIAQLCAALAAATTSTARVTCKAPRAAFDRFCRAAFAWGKLEPCTIVVEELAWVTHPGKAPEAWHELVTGGLKFGVDLVSITQRPAESDKTALSQATVVRCFQQERFEDARYMARELRVEQARVDALERLEYIERDRRTAKIRESRVTV
jgi:hypothetical protein